MTGWEYVHGEGDDPLGAPTYVKKAYGVTLDPPVSQAEMGQVISRIGIAIREYVEAMIAANEALRAATPSGANMKAITTKLMRDTLNRHTEETGQTFIVMKGGQETTDEPTPEPVFEHKTLAEKYGAYKGEMKEKYLNRAFLVRACEDHVLELEQQATTRGQIRVTIRDLLAKANDALPFMTESIGASLIPTLISDGWVLFNVDDETRILPYGKGVPNYDASKCAVDHPMWSRTLGEPWVV